MKDINYWNQFWTTGKIEDYLSYRAKSDMQTLDVSTDSDKRDDEKGSAAANGNASFEGWKDAGYAGLRGSDRDRAESRADW